MGMTKRVSNVVATNPPITVIAIGALISAPSDILMAMGNIPKIVVKAVINTGRKRTLQAWRIASFFSTPLRFNWLI